MAPAVVPPPKHIPTWKKLGLKLKYAKEEDEGGDPYAAYSSPGYIEGRLSKKRKNSENGISNGGHSPSEPAVKKLKTNTTNDPLQNGANGAPESHGKERSSSLSSTRGPDTPRGKHKSVSFTPETKEEDGDSVRSIHKKWIAIQKAKNSHFDPSKLHPALQAVDAQQLTANPYRRGSEQALNQALPPTPYSPKASSPSTPSKPRDKQKDLATKVEKPKTSFEAKQKKKKKGKKPKHQTSTPSTTSHPFTPPHLTYLTTYHTTPQTWKFSKSHQNHVLKHLFSPGNDDNHIPPAYDPPLLSYLGGLKGFDARQRIREQALQVRQDDETWLSTLDAENPSPVVEPTDHHQPSTEEDTQDLPKEGRDTNLTETMNLSGGGAEPGRGQRQRADYEAAVARLKTMLRKHHADREEREWVMPGGGNEQWDLRLRKRRRAEVVLWGVGEVAEEREVKKPPPPAAAVRQVNGFAGMTNGVHGRGLPGSMGRDEGKMRGTIPAMAGNVGKKIVFGGGGNEGDGQMHGGLKGSTAATYGAGLMSEGPRQMNGMGAASSGTRHLVSGQETTKQRKKKRGRKVRSGVPDDDDSSSSSDSDSEDETGTRKPRQEKPVAQQKPIRTRVMSNKEQVERTRSMLSSSSESDDDDDDDSDDDDDDSDSGESGSGSGSGSEAESD